MEKFQFNASIFSLDEILSRDQQKNILGGYGDGSCPARPCSVYQNGETRTGICESGWGGGSGTVMPCSCNTTFGVYTTPSGQYNCAAF